MENAYIVREKTSAENRYNAGSKAREDVDAIVTGMGAERAKNEGRKWVLPAMMVLGTVILYGIGTAWFMIQTGNALGAALGLCVLPFLPGDAAKIAAASILAPIVGKAIEKRNP